MEQPAPEQEKNGAMERMSEMLKQVEGNLSDLPEQGCSGDTGVKLWKSLLHRACYTDKN